eukprot:GHVT01006660.1.p1 GENE.GHVT01006660.1~~GHVT01006660.1.p1  ORF type:complete len:190 (-),score=3.73 GHVT01006660.1:560-1129(-)
MVLCHLNSDLRYMTRMLRAVITFSFSLAIPWSTPVPSDGAFFLAFSVNAEGQSSAFLQSVVVDTAAPSLTGATLAFIDEDDGACTASGTVRISIPPSSISDPGVYQPPIEGISLYFGSAPGFPKELIGNATVASIPGVSADATIGVPVGSQLTINRLFFILYATNEIGTSVSESFRIRDLAGANPTGES